MSQKDDKRDARQGQPRSDHPPTTSPTLLTPHTTTHPDPDPRPHPTPHPPEPRPASPTPTPPPSTQPAPQGLTPAHRWAQRSIPAHGPRNARIPRFWVRCG